MAGLNTVILLGDLTRAPERPYTPSGTPVSSFGLAVNRRYRQDEEQRDEVCYVDIVTYGRQAETVSEYLSQGSLALVEGRLQWRSWETEAGQKRSKHEVVAINVQFMLRARDAGTGQSSLENPDSKEKMDVPLPKDDDIPVQEVSGTLEVTVIPEA